MRRLTSSLIESRRTLRVAGAAVALLTVLAPVSRSQTAATLPFAAGERLEYEIKVGWAGTVGRGAMWVEGPVEVRGSQTLLLRSDFQGRVGWFRAFDRSNSWLDPQRMAVLRFEKSEQQPRSKTEERVEVFPEEQRWVSAAGSGGTSPTTASLDELSFIYYVRTLPLTSDSVHTTNRHFDAARNPVSVAVVGRRTVKTPAGTFRTIEVEMRVTDPARFEHRGIIRLFLTDDEARIPVRIESAAPLFGTAVFTLSSMHRTNGPVLALAAER